MSRKSILEKLARRAHVSHQHGASWFTCNHSDCATAKRTIRESLRP